jgi:hypothetical protein
MKFRSILGALALVATAGIAQAQVSIQTSTVDLTGLNDYSYNNPRFSLLSDQNGVVRFSLNSLAADLRVAVEFYGTGDILQEYYNIGLHNGYRLTGFDITGQFNGQTYRFNDSGTATNNAGLYASLTPEPYGTAYVSRNTGVNNLNGTQAFALSANNLNLTGNKVLQLNGIYEANAYWATQCGYDYCTQVPSYASIALDNPVLTLHTQAVPEPETYALMLAGLAGVGFVARRKKAGSVK